MHDNKQQNSLSIIIVDWDSQSLYTAAILENGGPNRGTESKTCKKKWAACRLSWNSTTIEHVHLCPICPTTILIGPFQRETRSPRRVPRLTALERDYLLMFIYVHTFRTVCLSVFVLEHLVVAVRKMWGLQMESV